MPRDDWRKARDRSVARAAKREFATDGRSSYPYVWGDDPAPESGDRPAPGQPGRAGSSATEVVWCVRDNAGVVVATFDYRDRSPADDLAARLTNETGALHDVGVQKVPLALTRPASGVAPLPAPNLTPAAVPDPTPVTGGGSPAAGPGEPWYGRVWRLIRRAWRSP